MRVLVTFAVDPEFAGWRGLRKFEPAVVAGLTVYRTAMGRANIEVVLTGMGTENARRATETALSVPCSICISSGFAGALRPGHKVRDILVGRTVQRIGQTKCIESSSELVTRAEQTGAKGVDVFLTSERVVGTIEEKSLLVPFGDAVDMESFAVLSAAQERNVPGVVIRVISDGFDQNVPVDFGKAIDRQGRVKAREIVREVVRRPAILPDLIRLGQQSKTAAESLASFLEAYIKTVFSSAEQLVPKEILEVATK